MRHKKTPQNFSTEFVAICLIYVNHWCPIILITSIIWRMFCVKGLVHIRESEIYLGKGQLLYNVIAVYIITVLIKTSAKCVSHYNLLAISFQIISSQQVSKFRYSRLKQYVDQIIC